MYTRINHGRAILGGKTDQCDYLFVVTRDHDGPIFDADGKQLGTLMMVMKEPEPTPPRVLTDEQRQRMADRRVVCETCDKAKGFSVVGVECAKCRTCRNHLSLIGEASKCPLDKWPSASPR